MQNNCKKICVFQKKAVPLHPLLKNATRKFAPANNRSEQSEREVAQLVAHYVRDVGVGRSSRLFSTEKGWSIGHPFLEDGLQRPRSYLADARTIIAGWQFSSRLFSTNGDFWVIQESLFVFLSMQSSDIERITRNTSFT